MAKKTILSAEELDTARAKTALIREINTAIRLYLMECKMEGIAPGKVTMNRLKGDRARLTISIMKMFGHE